MKNHTRRYIVLGLFLVALVCVGIGWSQWNSATKTAELDGNTADMTARFDAEISGQPFESPTVSPNRTSAYVFFALGGLAGISGVIFLATTPSIEQERTRT